MIVIDIGYASALPPAVNPELPRGYGESGEEGDFKKNQVEMEALVGISFCDSPNLKKSGWRAFIARETFHNKPRSS